VDDVGELEEEVKAFASDIRSVDDAVKDQGRVTETIRERQDATDADVDGLKSAFDGLNQTVISRIESLNDSQISQIATAAAADPTMKAVLQKVLGDIGFSADEIAELRLVAKQVAEIKATEGDDVSLGTVVSMMLGGGTLLGGGTFAAARARGSGKKVDQERDIRQRENAALKQEIEDLKTDLARNGKAA
jgi:hypothetical protein